VWGAHYLHDGAQPEGSGQRTRWGNCWVVVVLVVELPCLGGRQVGLPVLFRLFRPKDDSHPNRCSQPELGRLLVDMVIKRFPGRKIELVMDGAYASRAWRDLPARVNVTTRMRANAALHKLAAGSRTPARQGRPPLKGARLGSLAEIANAATFVAVTITGPDGRQRTTHIHEFVCLWYKPFYTRAVKVILIRNPGTTDSVDVALASTDTEVPAAELISRYDSRWTIETAHQEAKAHGVGDARNRVEKAVKRTDQRVPARLPAPARFSPRAGLAASVAATPYTAGVSQGSSRSAAINAPTATIHVRLITPSANRAAISPMQQPMQDAPCRTPPRRPLPAPGRASPAWLSGVRHRCRHRALAAVSW